MAFVAPLVVAGVSALSSYMGSRSQAKAARTQTNRLKLRASPEHLMDVVRKLMPFYRELVASGLGPQFLQESARQISLAGLSGTGVGEALRQTASAVPNATAAGLASEAGRGVVQNELASVGGMSAGGGNPLADALSAGASAYAGTAAAQRLRGEQLISRSNNRPMTPVPITPPTQPGVPGPDEPSLFPQLAPLERPGRNI